MDHDGDSNSMILDTLSPTTSSASREMLDEPHVPRRNSSDDNDPSRPRKRPAVMAASDDANLVEVDLGTQADVGDDTTGQPSADSNTQQRNANESSDLNKTMQVRESIREQGVQDVHLNKMHGLSMKGATSTSPLSIHSQDSDSDVQSISSASPEIEEVEAMDTADGLSNEITILEDEVKDDRVELLDRQVHALTEKIWTQFRKDATSATVIRGLAEGLARSPYPVPEMRAFGNVLRRLVKEARDDSFERQYLRDRSLCDNIPHAMDVLLKRTVDLNEDFFKNDIDINGPAIINQLSADFVRFMKVLLEFDLRNMETLPLEAKIELYSSKALTTAATLLKVNNLYELVRNSGNHMFQSFPLVAMSFAEPGGFLEILDPVTKAIYRRVPVQSKLFANAGDLVQISAGLVRSLEWILKGSEDGDQWHTMRMELRSSIPSFMCPQLLLVEKTLITLLGSNIQMLDLKEFSGQLEALAFLGRVLYRIQPTPYALRERLRDATQGYGLEPRPTEVSLLGDWTVRFPILFKMMSSSRMDYRLRGLTRMTACLVDAWHDQNNSSKPWHDSAILKYFVGFLLEKRVSEYLVGPESHHELIRRCGNVPSFLVVSGNMTKPILDKLWEPIVANKDPRAVQATLSMHLDLVSNMGTDQLVMLSERISLIPFNSFDGSFMDLIARVVEKIHQNFNNRNRQTLELLRTNLAPYEMVIRLIRLASEEDETASQKILCPPSMLYDSAVHELGTLVNFGPAVQYRRQIFDRCVQDIQEMNGSVTGSATVILTFLQRNPRNIRPESPTNEDDVAYLVGNLKLPTLLVQELSAFVRSHRNSGSSSRMRKLKARLDLLTFVMSLSPSCLSKELHTELWNTLVGPEALGPAERDMGFGFYSEFMLRPADFVDMLDFVFCELFPKLDHTCYSASVLQLCKSSMEYLNMATSYETEKMEDVGSVISIKGVEQLWRIIFTAEDDQLAVNASTTFVETYLDAPIITQGDPEALKATHLNIVDRCIEQLRLSAEELSTQTSTNSGEVTASLQLVARKFNRSLELLDCLVKGLKARPNYASRVKPDASGGFPVKGDAFTFRVRWAAPGHSSPLQTIDMGTLNTAAELHAKLSLMTGGRNRYILGGRELRLNDEPTRTLRELGFGHDCFLQLYVSAIEPEMQNGHPDAYSCDVVQEEIMQHFDVFYTLLDLPEPYSSKAWFFLRTFPPNEETKKQVLDVATPWTTIYPFDKPHKCLYSLYALAKTYDEHRHTTDGLSAFMRKSVPPLAEALSHVDDMPPSNLETRVFLMRDMLGCLKTILQRKRFLADDGGRLSLPKPTESVPESTYAGLITDSSRLVACVLKLLEQSSDLAVRDLPSAGVAASNALELLFEASRTWKDVWMAFSDCADMSWVRRYLLDDAREIVRKSTSDSVIAISTTPARTSDLTIHGFAEHFWPILCELVSTNGDGSGKLIPEKSLQLFNAARATFEFLGETNIESAISLDLASLYSTWAERLYLHPITEVIGRPAEDPIVIGYTGLLRLCALFARPLEIELDTAGTVEGLWKKLMFPAIMANWDGTLPVMHDNTRNELYGLFLDLVNNNDDLMRLVELNMVLFPEDDQLHEGYYAERDRWLVSSAGRGGLHNLSNTCYLNSLLTQLFMNEQFREFILGLELDCSEESTLTYSLHVLFARLQNGYGKGVEPRALVESMRDFAGEPIDPTIQMDVDEFFNLLFDRLESEMPNSDVKNRFRSFYGGHLVQQVKSKECEHISEREEAFSAIQCDIKGKATLDDSLKAYVEGEVMEGDNKYRCTKCDKLVDAVKRTCLKDVPDHLILHLKRFEFDLQTLTRSKINDYFEFPTTLDMTPYTMDYLSKVESGSKDDLERDEFELVGVLVHTGTAESGHYYSYIRDRLTPAEAPAWFEFNDSEVAAFNPATIPGNCYGGMDAGPTTGYPQNKTYSAYMLFYQRSSSIKHLQNAYGNGMNLDVSMPELFETISIENQEIVKRYLMFGNNYTNFLKELFEKAHSMIHLDPTVFGVGEVGDILLLALKAFEQICSRFKDCPDWDPLANSIQKAIQSDENCCRIFLEWASNPEIIQTLLISNPFMVYRQTYLRLLLAGLDRLKETNPTLYGETGTTGEENIRNQSMFFKLVTGLKEAFSGLQWLLRPWNDYFGFLVSLCARGQTELDYLLKAGFLRRLLEMFLSQHMSPHERSIRQVDNFPKLLLKPRVPAARPAEVISYLMGRCSAFQPPCSNEDARDQLRDQECLPLTQTEHSYFRLWRDNIGLLVFTSLVDLPGTLPHVGKIVVDIVAASEAMEEDLFLERIKQTFLNNVPIEPAAHAGPWLVCLEAFVSTITSREYIRDIVRRVAEEIPTIGMSGGLEHLNFFSRLADLERPIRDVQIFLVETVGLWAPALLVYFDEEVREETERLLDRLLFSRTADPSLSRACRRASLNLSEGCFDFIREKVAQNRQQTDERTFESVIRTLRRCKEFHQDEEEFELKMEELQVFIDGLVVEEEEDADLASGTLLLYSDDDDVQTERSR